MDEKDKLAGKVLQTQVNEGVFSAFDPDEDDLWLAGGSLDWTVRADHTSGGNDIVVDVNGNCCCIC